MNTARYLTISYRHVQTNMFRLPFSSLVIVWQVHGTWALWLQRQDHRKGEGDFLGCVVKEEAKTKKKQENHTAHRSCSFLLRMLLKWCVAFFLHGFCFLFLVAVHFLHVCYIVSWFLPGFCTFLFHRSSSMFHSKLVTVATCFEDDYPCIGVSDGSTVQIKASRNWSHWKKHVKSIVFPATCVTCRIEAGGCLGFGMLGGGSHLQSPPSWGWCYLVLDVC